MPEAIYTFSDEERHLIAAAQKRAVEAEIVAQVARESVRIIVADILQFQGVDAQSVTLAADGSAVYSKQ